MSQSTMSTGEVQALLHLGSPAAARVQLRRWGIEAVARALSGEKLWPAEHVHRRAANRPGRGARTDLKRATEEPTLPDGV